MLMHAKYRAFFPLGCLITLDCPLFVCITQLLPNIFPFFLSIHLMFIFFDLSIIVVSFIHLASPSQDCCTPIFWLHTPKNNNNEVGMLFNPTLTSFSTSMRTSNLLLYAKLTRQR